MGLRTGQAQDLQGPEKVKWMQLKQPLVAQGPGEPLHVPRLQTGRERQDRRGEVSPCLFEVGMGVGVRVLSPTVWLKVPEANLQGLVHTQLCAPAHGGH